MLRSGLQRSAKIERGIHCIYHFRDEQECIDFANLVYTNTASIRHNLQADINITKCRISKGSFVRGIDSTPHVAAQRSSFALSYRPSFSTAHLPWPPISSALIRSRNSRHRKKERSKWACG